MYYRGIDAYSFGPLAAMFKAISAGQVLRFNHEDATAVAHEMATIGFDVRIDQYERHSTVRLR